MTGGQTLADPAKMQYIRESVAGNRYCCDCNASGIDMIMIYIRRYGLACLHACALTLYN